MFSTGLRKRSWSTRISRPACWERCDRSRALCRWKGPLRRESEWRSEVLFDLKYFLNREYLHSNKLIQLLYNLSFVRFVHSIPIQIQHINLRVRLSVFRLPEVRKKETCRGPSSGWTNAPLSDFLATLSLGQYEAILVSPQHISQRLPT